MSLVKNISELAQQKSQYSFVQLALLSFLGGAYIALGGLLAVLLAGNLPMWQAENPGMVKFVFGAVFPLGLILVALAGAELFTGNNSYFAAGVFMRNISWADVLKNWILVFLFNFLGALFVAYFLAHQTELLNENQTEFIIKIGVKKIHHTFQVAFFRAIGCNWLVCLALWMAYKAKSVSGKMLAIWFPVMAFVAMGFEHSIANQFFVPLAIFSGADIGWLDFFSHNLLPVTLGNIVGGAIFVSGIYVMIEKAKKD